MTKKLNIGFKPKDSKEKVLSKSQNIKRTSPEDNKALKQSVIRNVNGLVNANGTANTAVVKHKKNKTKQGIISNSEDVPEKLLSKVNKKKEKKIKKKELKKIKKSECQNKDGLEDSSKPKEKEAKIKKDDKDQRYPFKEASTVFVGNLPVNTKRVQLIRLFKEYGPVNGIRFRTASGKVLFKHKERKEAGSLNAWVVLKDGETAKRAIDLNGTLFKNNHLRVTSAALNSSDQDVKRTVFVGNLKYSANEEKLREIFSSCGDIDYIRCLQSDKGCKGVAYVCFKTPEAVVLALELNETMLDERPINVERYSVKKMEAKKTRKSTSEDTTKTTESKKKVNTKHIDTVNDDIKKTKFRGVKISGNKKKPKKKVTSAMQKLANKIAPKEKLQN